MTRPTPTPFDLLPTEYLSPLYMREKVAEEPKRVPLGIHLVSQRAPTPQLLQYEPEVDEAVQQQPQQQRVIAIDRSLDEQARQSILSFIERRVVQPQVQAQPQSTKTDKKKPLRKQKTTFDLEQLAEPEKREEEMTKSMLSRLTGLASAVGAMLKPTPITKQLLVERGVTVQMLIENCRVAINDLKTANIVSTLDDLLELRFVMADLTRNKKLFSAQVLAQHFHVDARELIRRRLFGVKELLACNFYPCDLMALQFDIGVFIRTRALTHKTQLLALEFTLSDLKEIGFLPQHLSALNIRSIDARDMFKWEKNEYKQFISK